VWQLRKRRMISKLFETFVKTFFIVLFLFIFDPPVDFFPESSFKANIDYIFFFILRNWIRKGMIIFCWEVICVLLTFEIMNRFLFSNFFRTFCSLSQLWLREGLLANYDQILMKFSEFILLASVQNILFNYINFGKDIIFISFC